jgi:hypothetical protein
MTWEDLLSEKAISFLKLAKFNIHNQIYQFHAKYIKLTNNLQNIWKFISFNKCNVAPEILLWLRIEKGLIWSVCMGGVGGEFWSDLTIITYFISQLFYSFLILWLFLYFKIKKLITWRLTHLSELPPMRWLSQNWSFAKWHKVKRPKLLFLKLGG